MARIFRFLRILRNELRYRDPAPPPPLEPRVPYDVEAYGGLLRGLIKALTAPEVTGLSTAGETMHRGIPLPPDLAAAPDARAFAARLTRWEEGVRPWTEALRHAAPPAELAELHRLISLVAQFESESTALSVQGTHVAIAGRWAELQRLREHQQTVIGAATRAWPRLDAECRRLRLQDPPLWEQLALNALA